MRLIDTLNQPENALLCGVLIAIAASLLYPIVRAILQPFAWIARVIAWLYHHPAAAYTVFVAAAALALCLR